MSTTTRRLDRLEQAAARRQAAPDSWPAVLAQTARDTLVSMSGSLGIAAPPADVTVALDPHVWESIARAHQADILSRPHMEGQP